MANLIYNWKRYWVPRDGGFSFDQKGFLLPPASDAEWAKWWKTDAVSFDELNAKSCLVLLGEPGIGKSFALQDSEARAKAAKQNPNVKFLKRNLGIYGSDSHLVADIFDSAEFKWWENGDGELHVFLDSFDECLFRVDSLAVLLADRFTRLGHTKNLFLRIASRTAEWRTSLEDALRQKWGEKSVGVYELAPLTREQVLIAAEAQALDAENFVNAVTANEVVPFAIKPLTLDLLFRIWRKQGGTLPPTQNEIYEQGCLELCTENSDRQTPKLRRQFTSEERLAVASHIAAAMMFCKRSVIFTDSHLNVSNADVKFCDLAESFVTVKRRQVPITEAALKETLDTGLFTARGRDRMGWAHQTYLEFLAARYLKTQGLNSKQVLDLITHPHDAEHKLIPQLQETAAWIANSNKEIFDHLIRIQPDVLLRSDVATADIKTKALLVDSLLNYVAQDFIHADWWQMRGRYRKLNHAGLAKQLRRYLHDGSLAEDTRIEALQIAGECKIKELLDDFVQLALDQREIHKIREWSSILITRMGNEATKSRLKPLALGQCGPDAKDALRGAGLTACWPNYVDAKEVFDSIHQPDDVHTNLYSHFLEEKLVEGLKKEDLPIALAWAERQSAQPRYGKFFGVITGIMLKSKMFIDDDTIRNAYARVLLARFREHHYEFGGELNENPKSNPQWRLELIKVMVPLFKDARMDALSMTRMGCRLVIPEDLSWLIQQLHAVESPEMKQNFSHLISFVFYPDSANKVDLLMEAAEKCSILSEVMAIWLKPMELDSEATRKTREFHFEQKRYMEEAEKRKKPQPLSPSPIEQITALLDQFESGNLNAWWQITLWMERKDDGHYGAHHYYMDVREFPCWKIVSESMKMRLLAAAHRYVCDGDPKLEEWFSKKNIIYHPAVAGFRALLLLAHEAQDLFNSIPKEIWCKWSPVILQQHYYDELVKHRLLTEKMFELIPREATDWLIKIIDRENKEGEVIWVLQKLPEKWDATLGDALLSHLKQKKLKSKCARDLLIASVAHSVTGAIEFTRSLIPRQPPKNENRRQSALSAARLLMLHGECSDWPKIRRIFQNEPKFGCDLFEGFSHEYDHAPAGILKALSVSDVAELWEWMLAEYPFATDPDLMRGGTVTTRHSMAHLRNNLTSYLADMGTEAACAVLEGLKKKYPQFDIFRWQLSRAREQTRRKTWQPPTPNQIFILAEKKNRRLVQSADQLMQVVIDALARFQDKLQGKNPLANLLWADGRPKLEKDLSDWFESFLNDDLKGQGIIVGREVQIHRLDRLDLRIDAVAQENPQGSLDTVQVIVEVKGCWNNELATAMENQLVNRYLAKNDCHHGLYVVGWFFCDAWINKNPSKKSVKFSKKTDLVGLLADQASRLSTDHRKVSSVVLDITIPAPQKSHLRKMINAPSKRSRAARVGRG